jgi:uncharacterized protein YlxW (UPF0749 family)
MSGDERPDPAEDDVVVPHPFGPGSGAGRQPAGETADAGEAPERRDDDEPPPPGPTRNIEEPGEPEASEEREESGEPEEAGEDAGEIAEPAENQDAEEPGQAEESGEAEESEETGESPETAAAGTPSGRRQRDPLAAALIGVLTLLLGFAFAVQVRAVGEDQQYAGAREEDLVRILDELNAREERLRDQIADQRNALQQLTSSDSQSATALEEARARAESIGILNGTIAAQGPGLTMTIRDAADEVRVSDIVDAIQELRGAGAETMQIDGVRVGVSTAVTGSPGSLLVDGRPITSPYEFVVVGSPQNMETALNIPGGVVQDLTRQGASVTITQSEQVVVDALRPLDTPQYASPDTGG